MQWTVNLLSMACASQDYFLTGGVRKEDEGKKWKDGGWPPSMYSYNNDLIVQKEQMSVHVENNKKLMIAKLIIKP